MSRNLIKHVSYLVGADPGLDEGGDVLGQPRDEAVGLVVHQVKLLRHLFFL